MEHHVTATECHLPYGITQCYLLPDTSERTPPSPQPVRPVLDLPTPRGQKAELTYSSTVIAGPIALTITYMHDKDDESMMSNVRSVKRTLLSNAVSRQFEIRIGCADESGSSGFESESKSESTWLESKSVSRCAVQLHQHRQTILQLRSGCNLELSASCCHQL